MFRLGVVVVTLASGDRLDWAVTCARMSCTCCTWPEAVAGGGRSFSLSSRRNCCCSSSCARAAFTTSSLSYIYVHRYIYDKIHYIHHRQIIPLGFGAIYAHPLEHLFVNLLPIISRCMRYCLHSYKRIPAILSIG